MEMRDRALERREREDVGDSALNRLRERDEGAPSATALR